ncbi:hypothetical protein BGW38_001968, partial [Lunasporangiospora selenospora]
ASVNEARQRALNTMENSMQRIGGSMTDWMHEVHRGIHRSNETQTTVVLEEMRRMTLGFFDDLSSVVNRWARKSLLSEAAVTDSNEYPRQGGQDPQCVQNQMQQMQQQLQQLMRMSSQQQRQQEPRCDEPRSRSRLQMEELREEQAHAAEYELDIDQGYEQEHEGGLQQEPQDYEAQQESQISQQSLGDMLLKLEEELATPKHGVVSNDIYEMIPQKNPLREQWQEWFYGTSEQPSIWRLNKHRGTKWRSVQGKKGNELARRYKFKRDVVFSVMEKMIGKRGTLEERQEAALLETEEILAHTSLNKYVLNIVRARNQRELGPEPEQAEVQLEVRAGVPPENLEVEERLEEEEEEEEEPLRRTRINLRRAINP